VPMAAANTNLPLATAHMVWIPAGEFTMGNPEAGWSSDQYPAHRVTLDAYYMDRYEVSGSLYSAVVEAMHAGSASADGIDPASPRPAQVYWNMAAWWCNLRSAMDGRKPVYYADAGLTTLFQRGSSFIYADWSADGYRLPTEAEWERAARGAESLMFPNHATISHEWANYFSDETFASYDTSPTRGHHPIWGAGFAPVGSFVPNRFGLYDMAGNVDEWCWDHYSAYSADDQLNPRGEGGNLTTRVVRGGSYEEPANICRVFNRTYVSTIGVLYWLPGFRCVRNVGGIPAASGD
jgi:formylglycine-generating enzyme